MKKLMALVVLVLLAAQPALAKHPGSEHGHGGGQGDLPPGLQKKDRLPPGWQRKLNKGQRLDDDLYRHAVPLTRTEAVRLPAPPSGYVQLRIEDQVVEMDLATHRIRALLTLH
jgi:hypothetical protein